MSVSPALSGPPRPWWSAHRRSPGMGLHSGANEVSRLARAGGAKGDERAVAFRLTPSSLSGRRSVWFQATQRESAGHKVDGRVTQMNLGETQRDTNCRT